MTESLTGVDAGTAELILAMPCAGNDDVVRWFGLVQQCHLANPTDFTAFGGQLRAQASTFDATAVESFLERAKTAGEATAVARVLDHLPAKVDVYWQLAKPQASATTDPFAWVDQTQVQRLSAAWGTEWQTYLTQQLDYRWGNGWQSNPAGHKQAWLVDLLTELLGTNTPTAPPAAQDQLAWLTEEQAHTLSTAWGTEWRTQLTQQLDQRWGDGWQSNPAGHKQAWLSDLLPQLVPGPHTPDKSGPVDLNRIAEELVRASIGDVEGATSLSESELADVVAEVRSNLEEAHG